MDVAPPTGEKDIDRASILTALDQMGRHMLPLFTAWRDAGRPVELHAYESGGHDLGLSDRWIDAFRAWLAHHGLISEAQGQEPS